MTTLIAIGKVAKEFGVTTQTIRNWTKQGKFKTTRTLGEHRRYDRNEVNKIQGKTEKTKLTVTYARVSSNDQKQDLERQRKELKNYCQENGMEKIEEIKEIGSGINYNKRGLKKLIEWIIEGKVERIILSYKDRLLRFGIEILEQICQLKEVKIIVVNNQKIRSFEEELATDVLTILTVFCSKIYGKRSHEKRKKKHLKKIPL